ncbi:MAG: DUF3187 family protein [Armatimonadetes bacterium]|nr:DUF3187 family protein [Armatimonadota bacterium]
MGKWVVWFLVMGMGSFAAAGPVETSNFRTVSTPVLRLPFRSSVLKARQREFGALLAIANESYREGSVIEDAESHALRISGRWGIESGELYAQIGLLERSGGFMDSTIEWWHRMIGFKDLSRTGYPKNRTLVTDGANYRLGGTTGLTDAQVGFSRELVAGVTATAALSLPFGRPSRMTGSGRPNLGVGIAGTMQVMRQVALTWQAAAVTTSARSAWAGSGKPGWQLGAALEWTPNSRDAWIIQSQSESAPLRTNIRKLDQPNRQVTFGYRRKLTEEKALELFFSENFDFLNSRGVASVAADFSLGMRFVWRP